MAARTIQPFLPGHDCIANLIVDEPFIASTDVEPEAYSVGARPFWPVDVVNLDCSAYGPPMVG
jgi:hypothetical protein